MTQSKDGNSCSSSLFCNIFSSPVFFSDFFLPSLSDLVNGFFRWYLAIFTSEEAKERENKKLLKSKQRRDQIAELYSIQEARPPEGFLLLMNFSSFLVPLLFLASVKLLPPYSAHADPILLVKKKSE